MRSKVSVCAFAIASMVWGQAPSPDKTTPPTMNEPGVQHPLPVPRQTPQPVQPNARQPNVREPVTGTGREKPVSGTEKAAPKTTDKAAPKSGSSATEKSSSPASSKP